MVKNDHRSSEIRSLSKKFLYPFWVENLRSFRPFNSNNSGAPCWFWLIGIDAEDEMIRLLNEELTAQIDRDTIQSTMRPIADDLVSVQPMGAPAGRLFYMDFVYDGYNFKNFKLLKGW